MPLCRYVEQNSGQSKYSFTVNLDSCGTKFISDFEGQGQAYLENVLVLQVSINLNHFHNSAYANIRETYHSC